LGAGRFSNEMHLRPYTMTFKKLVQQVIHSDLPFDDVGSLIIDPVRIHSANNQITISIRSLVPSRILTVSSALTNDPNECDSSVLAEEAVSFQN
jgi:hypothetical protein